MARLLLTGDVMTGRGIDQAFAQSVDPRLHEPFVTDARDYQRLAERENGPIPQPLAPVDVWGDAIGVADELGADVRLINLETAVTAGGRPWPDKGIHYRMHPANVASLAAFGVDACALANNHSLDWGYAGLEDTVRALDAARIRHAGAGAGIEAAAAPARIGFEGGAISVFSVCLSDSGVPLEWGATRTRAGVHLIEADGGTLPDAVARVKSGGDLVVVSVHWGGNWGYEIASAHRALAHRLIDAGADVIHGHSAHHPKGVERYRGRPILYGCGDFINDYEGIGGHDAYEPTLVAAWLVDLDGDGALGRLVVQPYRIRRFRLHRADFGDARWLAETLTRHGVAGLGFDVREDGMLVLRGGDDG